MTDQRFRREHLQVPPSDPAAERAWAAIAPRLFAPPARRWSAGARLFVAAAGAALLLLVAMSLRPPGRSEERVVQLEDGSRVVLDRGARLDVRGSASTTLAVALDGRAAFDVPRRPGRRFAVHAGDVEVVVVGTRFSVGHAGGQVEVSVASGTVEVRERGVLVARLEAGQRWEREPRRQGRAPSGPAAGAAPSGTAAPAPREAAPPAASLSASRRNAPVRAPQIHAKRGAAAGPASGPGAGPAAVAAGPSAAALFEAAARARLEGRSREAAAGFDEIRRRHRSDRLAGVAAFQLGRMRLETGDWRAALGAFEDALRLAPDAPYRAEVEAAVVQALDRGGGGDVCARARDAYVSKHRGGPYAAAVARLCAR